MNYKQVFPAWQCPWKHRHVSAFPAFDREKCPWCHQAFILKKEASHAGSKAQF